MSTCPNCPPGFLCFDCEANAVGMRPYRIGHAAQLTLFGDEEPSNTFSLLLGNGHLDVEIWLPVVGWEGLYEVSDRVRSLPRMVYAGRGRQRFNAGRLLKLPVTKRGYLQATLCREGKERKRPVNLLVLEAFVGPCPPGQECCHGNDIKTDNRLENLRWDTDSANSYDQVRNGKHPMARKTHCKNGHPFDEANTGSQCQLDLAPA